MTTAAASPTGERPVNDGEPTFTQRAIKDLIAGLTVSFVAISLGAAFGAFAGRGAMSGILSAGVICLICALFGGTRIQCSGPTAPMSTVMLGAVGYAFSKAFASDLPGVDPDQFLNTVLVLTGVAIFLMGVFRLGRFITLVPRVVISGFMNGIAVLIWIGESKKLFGIGGKDPIPGDQAANVAIAAVTLVLCFVLPKQIKRIPKVGAFIPATLAVIVAMTAGVHLAKLDVGLVPMGSGGGSLTEMVKTHFPRAWSWEVIVAALPFAMNLTLLAYLDTLLTALVVDKKVKEDLGLDETTAQNKELAAQGLANGLVSLFGGIPGAQATIRSVLILKEGATMRLAGVAAGAFVLIEMLALQDWIAMIPSAVFAGVLIKVGYDVMDWPPLRAALRGFLKREPDEEAVIKKVSNVDLFFILGTTLITILVNLNVAVISFVVLYYVLKKASIAVPDLPELAGDATEEGEQGAGGEARTDVVAQKDLVGQTDVVVRSDPAQKEVAAETEGAAAQAEDAAKDAAPGSSEDGKDA